MTPRTWAAKKVEKAWQKHRGGLLDFTSGLVVSEHARAVRVVKRDIEVVKNDQRTYRSEERCLILGSLETVLKALQKGRT